TSSGFSRPAREAPGETRYEGTKRPVGSLPPSKPPTGPAPPRRSVCAPVPPAPGHLLGASRRFRPRSDSAPASRLGGRISTSTAAERFLGTRHAPGFRSALRSAPPPLVMLLT